MSSEEDRLIEAIESVRRDKREPWRYLLFTFLNGIAHGLGMMLGMTVVLGLVIYILIRILAQLVNFPVVGEYFREIINLIDFYLKQAPRIR